MRNSNIQAMSSQVEIWFWWKIFGRIEYSIHWVLEALCICHCLCICLFVSLRLGHCHHQTISLIFPTTFTIKFRFSTANKFNTTQKKEVELGKECGGKTLGVNSLTGAKLFMLSFCDNYLMMMMMMTYH